MNMLKIASRFYIGATVSYTTYMLLEEKSNKLVEEGGMFNAFIVGAGQMGLALTAGCIAGVVLDGKK